MELQRVTPVMDSVLATLVRMKHYLVAWT